MAGGDGMLGEEGGCVPGKADDLLVLRRARLVHVLNSVSQDLRALGARALLRVYSSLSTV